MTQQRVNSITVLSTSLIESIFSVKPDITSEVN
jgi:hypothetical protein